MKNSKTIGKVIGVVGFFVVVGLIKMVGGGKIDKYSDKWFASLSDDELDAEREVIRRRFCSAGDDFSFAVAMENLLYMFDKEMSKRSWNGKTDYGYPVHREHGWYLPNDD